VSALVLADFLTSASWWSFWPIALWGTAFAGHYLIYKARTVDESWVEERTANLHSKSYDASHIDRIAEDYGGKAADADKQE
jgi:2TM domain-containing protein